MNSHYEYVFIPYVNAVGNICLLTLQQRSAELLRRGSRPLWPGLPACRSASGQWRPLQAVGWRASCLSALQQAVSGTSRCLDVCCSALFKPVLNCAPHLCMLYCSAASCVYLTSAVFLSLPLIRWPSLGPITSARKAWLSSMRRWEGDVTEAVAQLQKRLHCSSDTLCVIVSGERDQRGGCWNSSCHLHKTALAGLRV